MSDMVFVKLQRNRVSRDIKTNERKNWLLDNEKCIFKIRFWRCFISKLLSVYFRTVIFFFFFLVWHAGS